MNPFLRMLARVTGRPIQEPGMTVVHNGKSSGDELTALARLSNRLWKRKIEFGPPGKSLNVITTADLDEATGKPYPDYLERRKREGSPRLILLDEDPGENDQEI